MSDRPLKVTFHLDGSGVLYDPLEPTHLDGLLAWCLCAYHTTGEPPRRDEVPAEIPLPLRKWRMAETWGWHASALFPDGGGFEGLQFWRKRFRARKSSYTKGSPSTKSGTYRDWQTPMPLTICPRMIAYAHGDRSTLQKVLRRGVKYIGKKAAYGKGRVTRIDVEWIEEDLSLKMDDRAMRWLPDPNGRRLVRPRPPYWNIVDRVRCCEIGQMMS